MKAALAGLCLSMFLTACATDTVYVTKREAVLPPAQYMEPCQLELGTTIGSALQGLRAGVDCERADKAAIKRWAQEYDDDRST